MIFKNYFKIREKKLQALVLFIIFPTILVNAVLRASFKMPQCILLLSSTAFPDCFSALENDKITAYGETTRKHKIARNVHQLLRKCIL